MSDVKRLIIIALFACPGWILPASLHAQRLAEVTYRDVLLSGDTLLTRSGYGDWWFGITGGVNINAHLGNLKLSRTNSTITSSYGVLDFGSGFGVGYTAGVYAEWNPAGNEWGGFLNVMAIDRRMGTFSSDVSNAQNLRYESEATLDYITVSPGVRYDLPLNGLYLTGGLDFEFRTHSQVGVRRINDTSAKIEDLRRAEYNTKPFRLGFQVGAGYEFLLFEFNRKFRMRMAPYVSMHFGTAVADDYGSTWNLGFARAGVMLKLGKNKTADTILRFDPLYEEPPLVIASLERQIDFEMPLFASADRLSSLELAIVERPVVQEEVIAAAPAVSTEVSAARTVRTEPPVRIDPRSTKTVNFRTSVSTAFDGEAQRYLDALADYLKSNPGAQVRIVGHTDAFGTPAETQRVSEDRANQVMQYLRRKGIPVGQIFASGVGARRPVADNRTEEGRRRNRRVEIVIVE